VRGVVPSADRPGWLCHDPGVPGTGRPWADATPPRVQVHGISTVLAGNPVLHGLDLDVPAGTVTVVMGLVFDTSLFGSLPVLENVTYGLRLPGVPRPRRQEVASARLAELDVDEHGGALPSSLHGARPSTPRVSSGNRRRRPADRSRRDRRRAGRRPPGGRGGGRPRFPGPRRRRDYVDHQPRPRARAGPRRSSSSTAASWSPEAERRFWTGSPMHRRSSGTSRCETRRARRPGRRAARGTRKGDTQTRGHHAMTGRHRAARRDRAGRGRHRRVELIVRWS